MEQKFTPPSTNSLDLITVFRDISTTVEQSMGGTTGAIYAIFFNAVANALSKNSQSSMGSACVREFISKALEEGLAELCQCTTARKGLKTLMDALVPFVEAFATTLNFLEAFEKAHSGAEGTRKLDAMLGRASYVSKENFEREGGVPDPGALGVVSVLRGIYDVLEH